MTEADADAVWMMQGWLFYAHQASRCLDRFDVRLVLTLTNVSTRQRFWTSAAIEAYLGGVPNERMILLDLMSEDFPIAPRVKVSNVSRARVSLCSHSLAVLLWQALHLVHVAQLWRLARVRTSLSTL